MFTIEEFNIWEEDVRNILLDLRLAEANFSRLNSSLDDLQFGEHIVDFFEYFKYQQKFVIIIQLSKLLSDRDTEKVNFYKVIRKLKSNLSKDLKSKILTYQDPVNPAAKSFDELMTDLDNELFQKTALIEQLVKLRDKQYAHKDNVTLAELEFSELQELINSADHIYRYISFLMTGGYGYIPEANLWDINPILMLLKRNFNEEK